MCTGQAILKEFQFHPMKLAIATTLVERCFRTPCVLSRITGSPHHTSEEVDAAVDAIKHDMNAWLIQNSSHYNAWIATPF